MKFRRTLLLASAIACLLSYSSCIKRYTCSCIIKYNGAPGLPDSVTRDFEIRDTKSKAESKCSDESGSYNTNNITSVETCELL